MPTSTSNEPGASDRPNASSFNTGRLSTSLVPRLLSILHDAEFVAEHVTEFNTLAVAANKRCGSWYWDVSLLEKTAKETEDIGRRVRGAGETYFKSTGGLSIVLRRQLIIF
jgi:hypothetical protein